MDDLKELTFMKGVAKGCEMNQLLLAISVAKAAHDGVKRKSGEPFISHPIRVVAGLYTLGIRDEQILAAAVLHDVKEDCGISFQDLVWKGIDQPIVSIVDMVSKMKDQSLDDYYSTVMRDHRAMIIKVADRCHNISTMVGAFTPEKVREYCEETRKYILPMIKRLKDDCPQYSDALFYMKYHIESVLAAAEGLLPYTK